MFLMLKMASLQPVFISAICFALVFNRIGADSVNFPAGEDDLLQKAKYAGGSDSELQIKIQQLESSLFEKTKELKEKDKEIALLHSKITSLQEELKKSKFVAQSNINEVMEVNGGWLPIPVARYLSDLEKNWKEHGKPSADAILQKAVQKKAEAVRWAGPHFETIKTEVKKFSKPYIDYIDSITRRPYLDKLGIVLNPCMKLAVHVYGEFIKSTSKIAVHVYGKFIDYAPKIAAQVYGKFRNTASKIAVHVHGKFVELTNKAGGSETNPRRTAKHGQLDE